MRGILILMGFSLWVSLFSLPAFSQSEYEFDLSEIEKEIEKKPYSIGGFLEFEPILFGLDRDAALYRLKFFDRDEGPTLEQYNLGLRLEGSYQQEKVGLHFRTDGLLRYDYLGWDGEIDLLEGYISMKPSLSFTVDVGKRVTKWGKGYAWNPVSFIDRPKDPQDPQEALEGFYVLTADFIKSLEGPLKTVAFTPVILPVAKDLNDDFGEVRHINFASKLYFLLWDTDLDLLFFTGGSRSTRYGFDFARNLKTNFEVHGELALITDFEKKSVDTQGSLSKRKSDVLSALLGIRYLTTNEITFIVEYYHNGTGFREDDAKNFYRFVDRAYQTFLVTGDGLQLLRGEQLAKETFARANPMRDYIYFRASMKEPFDILYFTPAVTFIINLNDQSFTLIPELLYSPKTNLELRIRGAFLAGTKNTEYGEKQNDYRLELRVRYFF